MSNIKKTVPNQKVITINKEICNKENLYSTINLEAMGKAAIDLDGNCFKLWVYFAKNQNNYSFALSSKAAKDEFGLKIDAYNRAVKVLQEKKYLIEVSGNQFKFFEIPRTDEEIEEMNNYVVAKTNNDVVAKTNNTLLEKPIRNIIDNTFTNITTTDFSPEGETVSSQETIAKVKSKEDFMFNLY